MDHCIFNNVINSLLFFTYDIKRADSLSKQYVTEKQLKEEITKQLTLMNSKRRGLY